jgi:superfamily I DNA and RNA helicase
VLGVGDGMKELAEEFEKLKSVDFELRFQYPTEEQRKQLKIVHRDVSAEEKKRFAAKQSQISELIDGLESGRYHLEDLDDDVRARLEAFFGRNR